MKTHLPFLTLVAMSTLVGGVHAQAVRSPAVTRKDDSSKGSSTPDRSGGSSKSVDRSSSGGSSSPGQSSNRGSNESFRSTTTNNPLQQSNSPSRTPGAPVKPIRPGSNSLPFIWPNGSGIPSAGNAQSNPANNYGNGSDPGDLTSQQDRRLRDLEQQLRFNDLKHDLLGRDLIRGGLPAARPIFGPGAPIPGGTFSIKFGGGSCREQTADDEAADGVGDEVFVMLQLGWVDRKEDLFAFLPPIKSRTLARLNNRKPILASAIADDPFEVYLQPGRHLLLVIPSVWEVDSESDESQDRATRLHDLIVACTADIRDTFTDLEKVPSGMKQGRDLNFPFVGGTNGGNRPIGMKRSAKGVPSFCPQVLVLDFREAQRLARQGEQRFVYKDDPATELGGAYELKIDISQVR